MSTVKGESTKDRVITTATEILKVNGYYNTSINDIIDATGVKKGNLYFHFSKKELLFEAILENAHKEYIRYLTHSAEKGKTGLQKIDHLLKAVYKFHKQSSFIGGCLFGNTALELSDNNPEIRKFIRTVFSQWTTLLKGYVKTAQEEGELTVSLAPEMLAKHIVATLEGGVMMAKVSKNGKDFLDCLDSIRIMMGLKTA